MLVAKDLEAAACYLSLGLLVGLQAKIIRSKHAMATHNKRIKKHNIKVTAAVCDVLQGCDQKNIGITNNWRILIFMSSRNNLTGTL